MRLLPELVSHTNGIQIFDAGAINNNGWIIAYGRSGGVGVTVSLLLVPAQVKPSDIDGNCRTNMDDLLMVISDWGQMESSADVNRDGIVNVHDLMIVINEWSF